MRTFGLIGYPLGHSFSRSYFTEKFQRENIPGCDYITFPLPSIAGLPAVLRDPSLCGLNVTIPYKEEVIAFLHDMDEVVRRVGACNCIKIGRGTGEAGGTGSDGDGAAGDGGVGGAGSARLYGYNTDVIGFERSLIMKLRPHHDRALILGTGGAAKAVEYVLQKLGIPYRFVSRNPRPGGRSEDSGKGALRYDQVDETLLRHHTLIINTTPLGMSPRVSECPPLPYEAVTPRHYLFDLVYNPAKTLFLEKGEQRGAVTENGYEMLVIQAEESWRIWNS